MDRLPKLKYSAPAIAVLNVLPLQLMCGSNGTEPVNESDYNYGNDDFE